MDQLWTFLQAEENRAVLAFMGAGVVALSGAVWAILKRRSDLKLRAPDAPAPRIEATPVPNIEGSVVAGRDIRDSEIQIHPRRD
jgi:hypothetical protein